MGNTPHFTEPPLYAPPAQTEPIRSPIVDQIGSLESLLQGEMQREPKLRGGYPLTVIAGGAMHQYLGLWDSLGVDIELIPLDASAKSMSPGPLGKHLHVKQVTIPHRLRLVAAWHAAAEAQGDIVVILNEEAKGPEEIAITAIDWLRWLAPIQLGIADVVYASRYLDAEALDLRWYDPLRWARWISNGNTGLGLTDVTSPYKIFRRSTLSALGLRERGALVEMEVLARLVRAQVRVAEVSVSTLKPASHPRRASLRSWAHVFSAIKHSVMV